MTLPPDLIARLRQNLTLTGDGNIVGNDNTVTVTKQTAGDYAIQIGELHLTLSHDEIHRILISNSQVGVISESGDVHVEGGIHFYGPPPPPPPHTPSPTPPAPTSPSPT